MVVNKIVHHLTCLLIIPFIWYVLAGLMTEGYVCNMRSVTWQLRTRRIVTYYSLCVLKDGVKLKNNAGPSF